MPENIFRIIQWNLLKPKNSKTILIVVDFHKKKIEESPDICRCFKLKLLKSTLFRNHLAREIFALDASNWLKPVASVFLNYLPDFYLITNKFGGCRASPLNGEKEIYGTLYKISQKIYITKIWGSSRSDWQSSDDSRGYYLFNFSEPQSLNLKAGSLQWQIDPCIYRS